MNYHAVERVLIDVLNESQRDGGYQAPSSNHRRAPWRTSRASDSKVAPAATSDLARKLGVSILTVRTSS